MTSRRNFIRKGILAATGAGIAANSAANIAGTGTGEDRNFIYRKLGKTGIKIPVISMGTGNTSDPRLVREAYDRGVKLFATSQYYQNGNNEKMVAEALKEMPRDSYYLMTGANRGVSIDFKTRTFKEETNPDTYLKNTYGCIERLGTDYIDVLSFGYGHGEELVLYEPLLRVLEKIKSEGKARFLSLTTHGSEPEAIRAAADSGVYDIVTTAYNFKRYRKEEIESALSYAVEKGLGIIAMKNFAGAYWDKEKTKPINAVAALKWVIRNENIHTTIPDCANYDQLEQDLAIMSDPELSEDEINSLKPPSDDLASGLYCHQCNECIPACREQIDIPTAMRSFMYAYGYRNLELARNTIDLAGLPELPCSACSECLVSCTAGFDVKSKIRDIARIRSIPEDLMHSV